MATSSNSKELKALWIGFAHDAMSRYQQPEDLDENGEIVDDMVDVVIDYADAMLDELEERFGGGGKRRTKHRREREEEEEEDPEDDPE